MYVGSCKVYRIENRTVTNKE